MLVALEQLQGISLGQVGRGVRAQSHLGSKIAASRLCKRKLSPPPPPSSPSDGLMRPYLSLITILPTQGRSGAGVQCTMYIQSSRKS